MRLLLVTCLCMGLTPQAFAREKLHFERIDLSRSPTVRLFLTLTETDGRVVTGRTKEELKLVLDTAEQDSATQMTTFDQTGEPINVVVVVQLSEPMNEVIEEIKRGVKGLANAVPAKSKMALLGFSSDTKRLAELGPPADVDAAGTSLAIDAEAVEVHLLDAVRTAIDLLNSTPKDQRRLVVLFSDGIDVNMEKKIFTSIAKRAVEGGIVIDTIGYAPFEPVRLRNLTELSRQSNGLDRSCKASTDVTTEFNNVVDEIRRQYVATFELSLAGGDSKLHTFQAVIEQGSRSIYSNSILRMVPPAIHPIVGRSGVMHIVVWIFAGCGGFATMVLVAWMLVREREEELEHRPMQQVPERVSTPLRTLALDAPDGSGKTPALGWIVAKSARDLDKTFVLKGGRTVIGTSVVCDVVVEDQFMSARHCEIRLHGGIFRIIDLGSTNGIVVNQKKVQEHDLVDNDLFRLGKTEFKFKSILS